MINCCFDEIINWKITMRTGDDGDTQAHSGVSFLSLVQACDGRCQFSFLQNSVRGWSWAGLRRGRGKQNIRFSVVTGETGETEAGS